MAYDEKLAERIRSILSGRKGVSEMKMFGGIAFMLNGNMFCGIVKGELMARLGPDGYGEAMAIPHTREMDFTGRPMKGMLYVSPRGVAGRRLKTWVQRCLRFAETLPPKR